MRDQKALRILFDTYWSSAGWKRNYTISSDDFLYARDAGYMFDPVHLSHDDIIHYGHPEYAAFDLEQFNKIDVKRPTEQDLEIMRQILSLIKGLEPQARPRDLEKRMAKVFESNKAEREILIQILAYCGILQPQNHAGYYQSFVDYANRSIPPVHKIDWTYPVCWWRGSDGINDNALEYYFPQLV